VCSSDLAGRFGKIWVDDVKGLKEPANQNTGNYAGKADDGTVLPLGQPRTVTVDVKAGEYIWFAEMEDNSGGVSGLIIRGVGAAPSTSVQLVSSATVNGTYTAVSDAKVDAATKTISTAASGAARFYRVQGSDRIVSSSVSGGQVSIKYQ
jgi:hypothetical protein